MTDRRVVSVQQLVPASVALGGRTGGGIHDVGEQHGLQHTVYLDRVLVASAGEELLDCVERILFATLGPVQVPVARELEEARIPNLARQVLATFEGNGVVASAMHDEGRRVHGG